MILLAGSVTVPSIRKLDADRTRDPRSIGFAWRLVTIIDWFFAFWRAFRPEGLTEYAPVYCLNERTSPAG